ncbi:PREDICTED: uncharacterized protein LOC105360227 [Ceratosolen solmsi marchali]|uniref:Uncharacterized protein LOC105360227 n=1 Tax=Ceratosolen solmsi marchali TaxID=326594 RepID=A0AAJ6YCP3_9HYME|nr:PREDICTED: uncharacterized protein LOC105360227 [Ceratosolen solmsi marchali]
MPLLETDYCVEQINVPAKLPTILKQFCKSAIRTQPYDLLKWSSAYFHALADGEEPPTKLRLEYPPASSAHGLTLGFLKVLLRQLGVDYNKIVRLETILTRWEHLCLDKRDFDMILRIGRFHNKCQIKKFMVIAVGLLTRCITETMIMVCELFTFEPEGGSAMIPYSLFMDTYRYIADLRCDGSAKSESICICAVNNSKLQAKDEAKSKLNAKFESESESESEFESELKPESTLESVMVIPKGPISVASQDTDVDVEYELESLSKEDVQSKISEFILREVESLQSFGEETAESFRHEGEASYRSSESTDSSRSKSSEIAGQPELNQIETTSVEVEEICDDVKASQSMITNSKKSSSKTSYDEDSEQFSESIDAFTNYPDVPGIGRQLLPEEVTAVAIWMTECSRRQEGIVGPRNIRHINCPPLTGICCRPTSSNSSLLTDT